MRNLIASALLCALASVSAAQTATRVSFQPAEERQAINQELRQACADLRAHTPKVLINSDAFKSLPFPQAVCMLMPDGAGSVPQIPESVIADQNAKLRKLVADVHLELRSR